MKVKGLFAFVANPDVVDQAHIIFSLSVSVEVVSCILKCFMNVVCHSIGEVGLSWLFPA